MRVEVERRVASFIDDLRNSRVGPDILAVIVSGSAAREEERWVDGALESDIDLMVVSRSSRWRLDRTSEVHGILARYSPAKLEGGRIPLSTLQYATLANYEARHSGVVAFGDGSVLSEIPMETPSDIPAWEAVRLLANRVFEHVKHRSGMTSGEAAAIKSYEAVGESQLVLEHRYRPSFAERVAEIEREPLASPVADAGSCYLAAQAIRRGEQERLGVSPTQALEDLVLQLELAMEALGLGDGPLDEQLSTLSRREFHLAHRVYWTLRGIGLRDGRHRPTADPILQIWKAALASLPDNLTAEDSGSLLRLWQECPQILKKGETP